MNLELGLVPRARELFGQFIVQLDDRAVCHNNILETL